MNRPVVTEVRVAPTRLPPERRPRLRRLARRGAEIFARYGAPLQKEMAVALEIALLDLEAAETRAKSAERRARESEKLYGEARARCKELERYAKQLETYINDTVPRERMDTPRDFLAGDDPQTFVREFSTAESTAVRQDPQLIEQCRRGQ